MISFSCFWAIGISSERHAIDADFLSVAKESQGMMAFGDNNAVRQTCGIRWNREPSIGEWRHGNARRG